MKFFIMKSCITAAKAAGLHAIDNVYLGLWRKDDTPEQVKVEDGLRKKFRSVLIGMDGTWVIHPQ